MLVSKENSRKIDHLDTTVGSLCIHKNHSFVHGLSSRLAANSLWKNLLKRFFKIRKFYNSITFKPWCQETKIYYLNDNHNTNHFNNCCAPFLNYRSGHLTNCFNLSWYAELMFQLSFANLHLVQFFLLSVVAYSEI